MAAAGASGIQVFLGSEVFVPLVKRLPPFFGFPFEFVLGPHAVARRSHRRREGILGRVLCVQTVPDVHVLQLALHHADVVLPFRRAVFGCE